MLKIKKNLSLAGIFSLLFFQTFPLIVGAANLTTSNSTQGYTSIPINGTDNQRMGSYNKEQNPKVTVSFSSNGASMTLGAKITATAAAGSFKEDSSKLYYTWYLKRKSCNLGGSPAAGCDLDGDGEVTVNDWKIAAAKIIVRGSYDSEGETYSSSVSSGDAGYEAFPSPLNHGSDKGWVINSGADINDKDAPNCYAQEPKSGIIYELRQVDQKIDSCPDGYQRVCAASDQKTDCEVLNPDYSASAAAAAQAAIASVIAWNADPANAANQKVVPAAYAVPKTIIKTTNKFCGVTNDNPVDLSDLYCKITTSNFTTAPYCYDNAMAMCVKYSTVDGTSGNVFSPDTDPITSPIQAVVFKKGNLCSSFSPNTPLPPNWLSTQNSIYNSVQNQKCEDAQAVLATNDPDSSLKCSATKAGNTCKHLFAKIPKSIGVTGDGEFGSAEKKFWGANPATASTSGTGVDEANVIGLGVDKFTWLYSTGDEVGLAVEGESYTPTLHADSTFKRMWAFSKNTCKALEDLDKMEDATYDSVNGIHNKKRKNMYLEGPGGGNCDMSDVSKCTGILTAEVDLDLCLPENLIDPTADENSVTNSKLTLQLASEPANPINDPNGKGDTLNVTAESFNTQNSKGLLYNWTVQISKDGSVPPIDTTTWKDITSALEAIPSFSAIDAVGLDKKKLAIKLNLSEALIKANTSGYTGTFYLKIKAKASGTATDGSQNAEGQIIIKVNQQQNEIKMYSVTANNTGMLLMDKAGSELCSTGEEKTKCPVINNEVIGLTVPDSADSQLSNFSWKANDATFVCSSDISSQCPTVAGNNVFIPIIGNVGEAIDITVNAIKTNTNEAITLTRRFVIVSPNVVLTSADEATVWPKLVGYYKDLNGNQYPDYSTTVYETSQDSTANLLVNFYPASVANQSQLEWIIDGEIQYDLINKTNITFPINKSEGNNYDVVISTKFKAGTDAEVNNIRKALLKDWNIETESVFDEEKTAAIQINVLAAGSQKVAQKNAQTGLASLISHLPENLMFLLKIVVTSGALMLLTGIVFAIIPGAPIEEKNQ